MNAIEHIHLNSQKETLKAVIVRLDNHLFTPLLDGICIGLSMRYTKS